MGKFKGENCVQKEIFEIDNEGNILKSKPFHLNLFELAVGSAMVRPLDIVFINSLYNVTYAVCYLHIKQIAISQKRTAIWKNYTWSPLIISRVLSNKTNLIFISYTL